MVSKLKPEPPECGAAAQCSELPTLARHMWAGLVYQSPMFYLACVKVVRMCAGARASICTFKGASKDTYQQSITSVIDELWRAAANWNVHLPKLLSDTRPPVRANVCVSICGWYLIHRMSLNLVALVWTNRNVDATWNRRLGWLCCNNPDIIKNKGWNTTITTH